jgi:uncharacterized cupredoxin-like copper-binding protein
MLAPRSTTWFRVARFVPFPLLALALAACGGAGKSGAAGGVAGTTARVAGAGQAVTATETEYAIRLSSTHLKPGRTTFVAVNKGHVGHSLEIDGPGVSDRRIAGTISPGSSKRLTVMLKSGSYELYCPIDGHKALGMDTHISVGGMAAAGAGARMTSTSGGTTTTKSGGGGY